MEPSLMSDVRDPESGYRYTPEEQAWLDGHMNELRRDVSAGQVRTQILWVGLAIGLAVHVVGYLLKTSATGEPIGLLVDLLYTLGFALWTGVVVVVLVEIIPAAKERQVNRWLDGYEAALRSRPPNASGESPGPPSRSRGPASGT
jgi:hypothetical protein